VRALAAEAQPLVGFEGPINLFDIRQNFRIAWLVRFYDFIVYSYQYQRTEQAKDKKAQKQRCHPGGEIRRQSDGDRGQED
jgi:hypothetical protein